MSIENNNLLMFYDNAAFIYCENLRQVYDIYAIYKGVSTGDKYSWDDVLLDINNIYDNQNLTECSYYVEWVSDVQQIQVLHPEIMITGMEISYNEFYHMLKNEFYNDCDEIKIDYGEYKQYKYMIGKNLDVQQTHTRQSVQPDDNNAIGKEDRQMTKQEMLYRFNNNKLCISCETKTDAKLLDILLCTKSANIEDDCVSLWNIFQDKTGYTIHSNKIDIVARDISHQYVQSNYQIISCDRFASIMDEDGQEIEDKCKITQKQKGVNMKKQEVLKKFTDAALGIHCETQGDAQMLAYKLQDNNCNITSDIVDLWDRYQCYTVYKVADVDSTEITVQDIRDESVQLNYSIVPHSIFIQQLLSNETQDENTQDNHKISKKEENMKKVILVIGDKYYPCKMPNDFAINDLFDLCKEHIRNYMPFNCLLYNINSEGIQGRITLLDGDIIELFVNPTCEVHDDRITSQIKWRIDNPLPTNWKEVYFNNSTTYLSMSALRSALKRIDVLDMDITKLPITEDVIKQLNNKNKNNGTNVKLETITNVDKKNKKEKTNMNNMMAMAMMMGNMGGMSNNMTNNNNNIMGGMNMLLPMMMSGKMDDDDNSTDMMKNMFNIGDITTDNIKNDLAYSIATGRIVVKNAKNKYRSYNIDNDTMTNEPNFVTINESNMIIPIPTAKNALVKGDTIYYNNKYYAVKEINADGTIKARGYSSNTNSTIGKEEDVMGVSFISKLVPITALGNMDGTNPMSLFALSFMNDDDDSMMKSLPMMMMLGGFGNNTSNITNNATIPTDTNNKIESNLSIKNKEAITELDKKVDRINDNMNSGFEKMTELLNKISSEDSTKKSTK